jgi:hypothetical protein
MRLTCYVIGGLTLSIVPAPPNRKWMDETRQRFAYRCLPLDIGNGHGWQILNASAFQAIWDGRDGIDSITVTYADKHADRLAMSHFGHGILSFGIRALFRTDPGYDLFVMGPTNSHKDAIQPLVAVVETDWSVATFTMNWRFTRARTTVAFERNEPFCMLFPIPRQLIEDVEPEIRDIESDPALAEAHRNWTHSRSQFLRALKSRSFAPNERPWQGDYFTGTGEAGSAPTLHRSRVRARPFKSAKSGESS